MREPDSQNYKERDTALVERRLREILNRRINAIEARSSSDFFETDGQILVGESLLESIERIADGQFQNCNKELRALADEMRPFARETEEFIEHFCPRVAQVLCGAYTIQEIEDGFRKDSSELNKWREAGRALQYEVRTNGSEKGTMRQLILHVPPIIDTNPIRLKGLFMESLRELAKQIDSDPSLADVSEISGTAWIVDEFGPALKALTFSFREEKRRGNPHLTAYMSRKDFLDKQKPWNRGK